MPRAARQKSKSGIYHIMLRGVNRQEIIHDDEDVTAEIKRVIVNHSLGGIKDLPKEQRDEGLRKIKGIDDLSLRQTSRILGISHVLIHKA